MVCVYGGLIIVYRKAIFYHLMGTVVFRGLVSRGYGLGVLRFRGLGFGEIGGPLFGDFMIWGL